MGIEDPTTVRRNILETSKSFLQMLKSQHSLRELRMEKQRLTEDLRNKITETNELVMGIKQMLPQAEGMNLPGEERKKESQQLAKSAPKEKAKRKPKPRLETHLDKVENELQDIENKLHDLS